MGGASRALLVGLRIWQLICSVIVLGILASFLHRVSNAGATRDGRIIYSIITASISTVFSIVFIAPFLYAFLAFPADFALFVMWLVVFCLLITRTGIHTCSASWYYDYWGYYWGGWWRRPSFIAGTDGCGQWRTVLAFSFMAMFAFLVSTILGAYVVSKYWHGNKHDRTAGTTSLVSNPQTSQIGGPTQVGPPGQTGGVVNTGPGGAPGTGQPGTYTTTGQTGTYV